MALLYRQRLNVMVCGYCNSICLLFFLFSRWCFVTALCSSTAHGVRVAVASSVSSSRESARRPASGRSPAAVNRDFELGDNFILGKLSRRRPCREATPSVVCDTVGLALMPRLRRDGNQRAGNCEEAGGTPKLQESSRGDENDRHRIQWLVKRYPTLAVQQQNTNGSTDTKGLDPNPSFCQGKHIDWAAGARTGGDNPRFQNMHKAIVPMQQSYKIRYV